MNRTYFLTVIYLFVELIFLHNITYANNSSYITLSNQVAMQQQLDVVANNAANINTHGYEQDDVIFKKVNYKQKSKKKNDTMVFAETTYKGGDKGSLDITNNPLDLAIADRGYFKILTPRGPRYTLNGAFFINHQNIIVNTQGFPLSNENGAIIEMPDQIQYVYVAQDGTIFVNDEAIDKIGVFDFQEDDPFIKEGENLYRSSGEEIALNDFTLISGALRQSNVKQILVMSKLIELQRSVGATGSLMGDIGDLEKAVISKLPSK